VRDIYSLGYSNTAAGMVITERYSLENQITQAEVLNCAEQANGEYRPMDGQFDGKPVRIVTYENSDRMEKARTPTDATRLGRHHVLGG
jgi:hypothetical protein